MHFGTMRYAMDPLSLFLSLATLQMKRPELTEMPLGINAVAGFLMRRSFASSFESMMYAHVPALPLLVLGLLQMAVAMGAMHSERSHLPLVIAFNSTSHVQLFGRFVQDRSWPGARIADCWEAHAVMTSSWHSILI